MLLDVVLLSFVIAFLRGGRLRELPSFRSLPLLGASIALQVLSAFFPGWGGVFVSLAYLFTLVFLLKNREYEDIRILMIGWFMNALVIWTNHGKMPIDLNQASKLPYSLDPIIKGQDFKHAVLTESTNLPFLSDVIYMPFLIPRVISMGDIFIMFGAFLLVQRIFGKPISLIRLREGKRHVAKP